MTNTILQQGFIAKLERTLAEYTRNNPVWIEKALRLSRDIHHAESQGYQLSRVENRLWLRLTDCIDKG